jgi:hypothetical protein
MVLLVGSGNLSRNVAVEFAMTLPALLAGTALGIFLFGKIDDATFRRFVLGALLVSGLSFVFS